MYRTSRSLNCHHKGFTSIPWAPGYQFNVHTQEVISCVRGKCGYVLTTQIVTENRGCKYLGVRVSIDGCKTKIYLHDLVAYFAHGPKPAGLEVRHFNGDSLDNSPRNLIYGTHRENAQDAVRHGTNWQTKKTRCKYNHEFTPENTIRWGPNGRWRRCRACKILQDQGLTGS